MYRQDVNRVDSFGLFEWLGGRLVRPCFRHVESLTRFAAAHKRQRLIGLWMLRLGKASLHNAYEWCNQL
jgi:hypothetical protein